ncbi:MAG: Pr6Pr family membrane protein [Pseudomonadota bacterium]
MWYWGLGGLAALALVGQVLLNMAESGDGPLGAIWFMLQFFTIWTNLVIAVVFLRAGFTGRVPGGSLSGAMTLWIVVVGLVYWALLYRGLPPSDPEFYTDHAFHTLVPLGVAVWFWVASAQVGLVVKDAIVWLVYPLGYGGYVLLRGAVTAEYPYFFLDVGRFGYGAVLLKLVGFAALFFVLGLVVVWLSRRRA